MSGISDQQIVGLTLVALVGAGIYWSSRRGVFDDRAIPVSPLYLEFGLPPRRQIQEPMMGGVWLDAPIERAWTGEARDLLGYEQLLKMN